MPGITKGYKSRLTRELQSHHENTEKVNMQGRNPLFQKRCIAVEYLDEKMWEEKREMEE